MPQKKSGKIPKTCLQCGKDLHIMSVASRQKFCDRGCQQAYERLHRTCRWCGRVFPVSSGVDEKFCSPECHLASRRALITREELDYWYNELGETTEQIGRRLGISGRTVRDIMEKFGLPRRSKVEAAIDYPRYPFSGDKVEQAYLHGFRDGDLNVRKDLPTSESIRVRCGTSRAAQVDLIRQLFEPYGYVHTRRGTKGETQVECGLDMSFSFLLNKNKAVPRWIMRNDACFWAFLAGYLDAEGYISISGRGQGSARVEITSGDKGILEGLWTGLDARGVRCPRIILKVRAGTMRPSGRKHNIDIYRLFINRKVSLDKLFREIDPYLKHRDKREEMARAWANVRKRGLP